MKWAYKIFSRIGKVAELLERRLGELGVPIEQQDTQKISYKSINQGESATMILDPETWYEHYISLRHVTDTLYGK